MLYDKLYTPAFCGRRHCLSILRDQEGKRKPKNPKASTQDDIGTKIKDDEVVVAMADVEALLKTNTADAQK